jgi:pyruvate dehydrogenase E2 component (dihydrolipoamide acetyltransferase)
MDMRGTPEIRNVTLPDGRSLRVRQWSGEGRPFVLLHGLLDDAMGWAQLARHTTRPCLAMDLPGFGGSDLPTRPRISAYAEDVAAALDALAVRDCILVGHSLGGAVAAGVVERSRRVGSLALLAPAGFGSIRLAEAFALPGIIDVAMVALPLGLVNPLTVTAAYTTFVARRRLPPRELTERLRRRAFQSAPGVRMAVTAIAVAGRSPNGYPRRRIAFDGPVAALWGARDPLVPSGHAEALRAALPQATIEVWPAMGHHPQNERPEELYYFLEECARPRPDEPVLRHAA